MERVDFYIVESEAPADCDAVVCRLAEKAWDSGLRLHIRTTDAAQAARMDKMLWIYRQDSFLPHGLLDDNSDDPIVLGAADQYAPTGYDMLINLAPDVSARLDAYQRVAEVACREPVQLKAARSRFKWYRDQGLEPSNHVISASRGR